MNTIDIRFGGFYESLHSDRVDDAAYDTDDMGERIDRDVPPKEFDAIRAEYGSNYVDFLNDQFGSSLKFMHVDSPREYNFSTDVFIAECSDDDFERIIDRANEDYPSDLNRKIYDACTHVSGYIALNTIVELVAKRDMLASVALEVLIYEELDDEWEQYFDMNCVYDSLRQ